MEEKSMGTKETISVGRARVSEADAVQWLTAYTDEAKSRASKKPYAFPAYDRFESGSATSHLNDGDLLAPVLLNVGISIRSFYGLQAVRGQLETALQDSRLDTPLAAAPPELVEQAVSSIYGILDDPKARPIGIWGTKLSKVVHRKRPAFLVLHDKWVRACYVGKGAPVPLAKKRSWADYMVLVTLAIQADLQAAEAGLKDLREQVPSIGELSDVRVLDILAWKAGQKL